MSVFFVSCPLNFENELVLEIKSFWFEMLDLDGLPTRSEIPEFEILQGGIEFESADHLGFQINFFSKIANRVLLRINKFEARYFDQFEKGLSKIDFAKYLNSTEVHLKVEYHKSRLNNEKNLIEAATNVLKLKSYKVKDNAKHTIYIRIEKDRVTISLDTSGEHLHRRGYAVYRGEAPLRETLAAYLIRQLQKHVTINSDLSIIDPFAGSGSILFEASIWNKPNIERVYSWLDFKNAPKLFQSSSWKKNFRWFENQNLPQCLAYDIDSKSIDNISKNEKICRSIYKLDNLNILSEVKDSAQVAIDRTKLKKSVWVVCNPPYGIRLADDNAKQILEKIEESVDGVVVIHPVSWKFRFNKLKNSFSEDFSNQGLNLKLSIFKK